MNYHIYGLNMTQGQMTKLQKAAKKNFSVSTRVSHDNLSGEHKMLLTQRQAVEKWYKWYAPGAEYQTAKTKYAKGRWILAHVDMLG